jgi:hypothetical protein
MEKKQTAVEWLVEQLDKLEYEYDVEGISILDFDKRKIEIENQAKQMMKEQMKDVYLTHCVKSERLRKIFEQQFDDFYNETYGQTKN